MSLLIDTFKSHSIGFLLLAILFLIVGAGWWLSKPAPRVEPLVSTMPVAEFQPALTDIVAKPAQTLPLAEKPRLAKKVSPSVARQKIHIVKNTQRERLLSNLQEGFDAYQQGRYAVSRAAYQRALKQDNKNRDALLGLAANSMRLAQDDAAQLHLAQQHYLDVLGLNPLDAAALAGLSALDEQFSQGNSIAFLKDSIQQSPGQAALHYSLASKYARQRNWSQAQAAYFSAYDLAPSNADYAFNLAVSLDHLGQFGAALAYYKKSLALAASSPSAIDLSALQKRMQHLQGGN